MKIRRWLIASSCTGIALLGFFLLHVFRNSGGVVSRAPQTAFIASEPAGGKSAQKAPRSDSSSSSEAANVYFGVRNLDLTTTEATVAPGDVPKGKSDKVFLSAADAVTTSGLGPIKIGMTLEDVQSETGLSFVPSDQSAGQSCQYFQPVKGPKGLGLMVVEGRVIRIDIWPGSSLKTLSGAGIGSTEAEIKALYPDQLAESEASLTGGKYLTFLPADKSEQLYRLVFELDAQGKVVQYRTGQFPAVTWPEGCM